MTKKIRTEILSSALAMMFLFSRAQTALSFDSHSNIKQFSDKWAVIIGISKFADESWNFKHAIEDAKCFRKHLITEAKVSPGHIRLLQNEEATRKNILKALDWLKASAKPTDLAIVYIRTRGTYPTSHTQPKHFLATSDTKPDAPDEKGIELQSFAQLLNKLLPETTVAAIIDADFSDVISDFASSEELPRKQNGKPLMIVCSAREREIAWEVPGRKTSLFTGALLSELRKKGRGAPLLETALSAQSTMDKTLNRIRKHRTQTVSTLAVVCGSSHMDVILDYDSRFQERVAAPKN